MISKTFTEYNDAKEYVMRQGFDYWRGTHVKLDEGYQHIFIFEYRHKENDSVCRMADLRWEQIKVTDDRIPDLIGFIQVSIKESNEKIN